MGIFSFIKGLGRDVEGETAQAITDTLTNKLPGLISNLQVSVAEGTVTIAGEASSEEVREKAILLAGNVKGVEAVDDDGLTVASAAAGEGGVATVTTPKFYTVQKGDTLSKIAKVQYGSAGKWRKLFEANREVIEDPDLIYPGQTIRIPDLSDNE